MGHPECCFHQIKARVRSAVIDMKDSRTSKIIAIQQRLAKARRLLRKRIPRTISLVDELIGELRKEARQESPSRS
jgi:hypothetical protein